jgi:hypothetical protein
MLPELKASTRFNIEQETFSRGQHNGTWGLALERQGGVVTILALNRASIGI